MIAWAIGGGMAAMVLMDGLQVVLFVVLLKKRRNETMIEEDHGLFAGEE
jgi:uncharacterized protein YhhL (DUF1145 family)